jgi:hypothetical protein
MRKERDSFSELIREVETYIKKNYPVEKENVESMVSSLEHVPNYSAKETMDSRLFLASSIAEREGVFAIGNHLPTILAAIKSIDEREYDRHLVKEPLRFAHSEYVRILAVAETTSAKRILQKLDIGSAVKHLKKAEELSTYYTRLT